MSSNTKPLKEIILENLRVAADEPNVESELFQFELFSRQLADFLLDPKTPTRYTIGIHGEWGGGKTSLMLRAHKLVVKELPENWKTIWFDAWEYERLDPMLSLMQTIASKYPNSSQQFKRVITGLLKLTSDITLRATTGLNFEEVEKLFKSSVKNIPTVTEQLESMLKQDRLIVFIDDLDRCLIDNAFSILETIKLFLNAKGVLFVIAADMTKLERAWELRYKGLETGMIEGREHLDKIFQLKLSLPPKESSQIDSYIKTLASSLPYKERQLIVNGCPSNPRKIKRILNLVYFLSKGTEENVIEKYFPLIVIWSIATIAYPELAKIIKASPRKSLVQMSLISYHMREVEYLLRKIPEIKKAYEGSASLSISNTLSIDRQHITPSSAEGLEYAANNPKAFDFLKAIANHYSIWVNNDVQANLQPSLEKHYNDTGKIMSDIIFRAGLIA